MPDSLLRHLRGTWTDLVTPFNGDQPDLDTLRSLVERQVASGVTGLTVAGPSGEGDALTSDTFATVVRAVTEAVGGAIPVIAGIGDGGTPAMIERGLLAESTGVDGLLFTIPMDAQSSGVIAMIDVIADRTNLPIMLRENPVAPISIDTLEALVRNPHIVGLVLSESAISRASLLQSRRPDTVAILAGTDALALPVIALGGHGILSAAANLAPETTRDLVAAALDDDLARARRCQIDLSELHHALTHAPSPVMLKVALDMMGLASATVQPPRAQATTGHAEALNRALRSIPETKRALLQRHPEMRPTI